MVQKSATNTSFEIVTIHSTSSMSTIPSWTEYRLIVATSVMMNVLVSVPPTKTMTFCFEISSTFRTTPHGNDEQTPCSNWIVWDRITARSSNNYCHFTRRLPLNSGH